MTVGNKIKNIRLRRNYTQKYMAQALGMSHANYGKMESGVIGIAPERIGQIAVILNVGLAEIVDHQEETIQEETIIESE